MNQNSSFTLSNQSLIVSKDQGYSYSTNTSKFKSKYSSIGPKTETYLKNYTSSNKRVNETTNRIETKKGSVNISTSFNNINKDSANIKKKKSSFEEEKKDMGSCKKINVPEVKNLSLTKEQINEKI